MFAPFEVVHEIENEREETESFASDAYRNNNVTDNLNCDEIAKYFVFNGAMLFEELISLETCETFE